jgi:hypothetical protein
MKDISQIDKEELKVFILNRVDESKGPIFPEDIYIAAAVKYRTTSTRYYMKPVVFDLIRKGILEFTWDWRLFRTTQEAT